MEPEPEDEEQAAAAAATEAPDESTVAAARVSIAGHEIAAKSTTLDVSGWKLAAAQVREVAGTLPQLLCLRELVLDGLLVSGTTPRLGDFRYGVETLDADLDMFQAFCECLRALPTLTSLSLEKCYLGAQALAVLADLIRATAALNSLTVDSTGVPYDRYDDESGPRTYTLTVGEETIDVSQKNLGPADVTLVTTWMQRPEVSAVLASLTLSGNKITGTKYDGGWKYDVDLAGFSSLCQVLGKLNEVNLSDCGLGPASMPELAKAFSDAEAVLTSVNCLKNPLGDEGLATLVTAVEASSIGSICGLTEGQTKVDWSKQKLDPFDCKIIAADFGFRRFSAAIAHVALSGNMITGSTNVGSSSAKYDLDLSGIIALGEAVVVSKTLTSIDLSKCGISVAGVTEVAKFISAGAALAEVSLAGNMLTGSTDFGQSGAKYDLDVSGLASFCACAGTIECVDLSNCGIGVAGMNEVANLISIGTTAELNLSGNPITGSTKFDYKWNTFDVDMSSFKKFCDVLPAAKSLVELNLSDCGLSVKGVNEVANAISAGAVLARVSVLSNPIGSDGADALIQVFNQNTKLRTLLGIEEGVTELNLSKKNVDPGQAKVLAAELKASRAVAVLEEVNLAFNKIGAAGGSALVEALKTSNIKFLGIGKQFKAADGSLITRSRLKVGVTLSLAGRVGEVTRIDSDNALKLKWQDDESESSWIKVNELDGQPLNLPIQSEFEGEFLDVSQQQLDPGYAMILAWWLTTPFSAAIAHVALSGNMITGSKNKGTMFEPDWEYDLDLSGLVALGKAVAISKTLTSIDLSKCGISVLGVTEVAKFISAGAALASLNVSDNDSITGKRVNDQQTAYVYGEQLKGWKTLCSAIGTAPSITEFDCSKCALTPPALAPLTEAIKVNAVMKKVALSGNPLTGGTPEQVGPTEWIQTDGKDISGVSVLFPSMTQVTELDVSDCGLGPTSMPELTKLVSDATAVLTRVSVLSNPIGADGADALIQVFEQNTNLRTLLGIEEGVTEVNLSNKNVDPGQAKILAAELKASRAVAVLTDVNMSGNPLTGKTEWNGSKHVPVDGKDISGVSALFPVMTTVTKLNVSECGLGPTSMPELANLVRDARAVINEVNVSQNPIGVEGGKALANAIPESSLQCIVIGDKSTRIPMHNSEITSLDVSAQELGPGEVTVVAAAISTYAAVTSLAVHSNQIGGRIGKLASGATPVDSPQVGSVVLEEDVFYEIIAIEDGMMRWKEITNGEVLDEEIPLEDLESDELSVYTASDFSIAHPFGDFCNSLKTSQVTSLNLSECELGSNDLTELAEYVREATAVLARVSVLSNPIGADGADALIQVFEQNTNLRTLLGIEEGVTELNLSKKNVDPGQAKILAAELKASRAAAVLASLTLAGNPLTGAIYTNYTWQNIDSDMAGFVALCAVLGKLNDVDLSDCHLGPASIGELAKVFSDARAAIASLTISDNRNIGEAGADPLMDIIRETQNKTIVNIQHDGCNIRAETSKFFTHWLKLTSWALDNTIEDTNGELVRCAAEHGHPLLTDPNSLLFSTQPLTLETSIVDMVQLLSGDERHSDFEGGHLRVIEVAKSSKHSKVVREWAQSFGTFLGRYHIDSGPPVHRSATCEVRFATDCRTSGRVALKLMRNQHQFEAEITRRRVTSTEIVIAVIGWHTPNDCMIEGKHETSSVFFVVPSAESPYEYVLVMSCGERSLHDACAKERIAGIRLRGIKGAARCVASCLQELHANAVCHGDLKQRNVLRLNDKWILCDMDAASSFELPIGDKTSTAYCPPELARAKFAEGRATIQCADPSFDVWSFGVILFELCSGQTLFTQDISNDELIDDSDKARLCAWLTISDDKLAPVLSSSAVEWDDVDPQQTVSDAKNLIRWCLNGDPTARPTVTEVLSHRFLCTSGAAPSSRPMRYHAFMSHAQADASGTVGTLFLEYEKLGLHNWIDMKQALLTLEGMRQGVRDSQVFLLVLSEHVLGSWFCQQELRCAISLGKPIQLVVETDDRFNPFDFNAWNAFNAAMDQAPVIETVDEDDGHQVDICRVPDLPFDKLPVVCRNAVNDNLPNAVTYRRRNFEVESMMRELCARNGVALPAPAELRTDGGHSSAQLQRVGHNCINVLVVCNHSTASAMETELSSALEATGRVVITADPAEVATVDKVLLLLSKDVLTPPSLEILQSVLRMDGQQKRSRTYAVFSKDAGWRFGCDEQTSAPEIVRHYLNQHEALEYRAPDPDGPNRHEFGAMFLQLLRKLGLDGSNKRRVLSEAEVARGTDSDVEPEPESLSVGSDMHETVSIGETMKKNAELAATIRTHEEALAAKEAKLEQVSAPVTTKNEALAVKDTELAAKDAELEQALATATAKNEALAAKNAELEQALATVTAAKDEALAAKDAELEQALAANDEALAAKEAELQALAARLAAFEGVPPQ